MEENQNHKHRYHRKGSLYPLLTILPAFLTAIALIASLIIFRKTLLSFGLSVVLLCTVCLAYFSQKYCFNIEEKRRSNDNKTLPGIYLNSIPSEGAMSCPASRDPSNSISVICNDNLIIQDEKRIQRKLFTPVEGEAAPKKGEILCLSIEIGSSEERIISSNQHNENNNTHTTTIATTEI